MSNLNEGYALFKSNTPTHDVFSVTAYSLKRAGSFLASVTSVKYIGTPSNIHEFKGTTEDCVILVRAQDIKEVLSILGENNGG